MAANTVPMVTTKKPVALIKRFRQNKFYLFVLLTLVQLQSLLGQSTPCNTTQSLSANQTSQIAPLLPLLDTALYHESVNKTDSLCTVIKNFAGAQGGLPDQLETAYVLTTNATWLTLPQALSLAHTLITNDSAAYDQLWKTAQGRHPQKNYADHSLFLRFAAENAVALLQLADKENDITRKTRYTQWATRTLDTLLNRQLPSGAFPFPDLRTYNDPTFSPIIQAFLLSCGADSVNVLVNGWLVNDKGTGEFKFDAGIISNAFYQAYLFTGNLNYKTACVKAANFLAVQYLNRNFNYNSFAALGCVRGYQLAGDTQLLKRASLNMRIGLLPGQLPNGRWFDGHNARSVYHGLMLKHLSEAVAVLPAGNDRDTLINSLLRGITNQNTYYRQCGYSGAYRWQMACLKQHFLSSVHDTLSYWIGRHIQQSAINGKFLDMPTIGDYLTLLSVIASIPPTENAPQITIYPNPMHGRCVIKSNESNLHIEVVTADGRCVLATTSDAFTTQLQLPSIVTPGLYFLIIENESGRKSTHKILYLSH